MMNRRFFPPGSASEQASVSVLLVRTLHTLLRPHQLPNTATPCQHIHFPLQPFKSLFTSGTLKSQGMCAAHFPQTRN